MIESTYTDQATGALIIEARATVAGLNMTFVEAVSVHMQAAMTAEGLQEHIDALRHRCRRKLQEGIDAHNQRHRPVEAT